MLGAASRVCAATTLLVVIFSGPAFAGEGGEPAPGTIGFTFDDGPDPRWTPVVLDILDEYDAKATFFVLGWKVDRWPELAAEIVARGHSIQPHGYTHALFTRMSNRYLRESLMKATSAIYRATGVAPTCVRPPHGASSQRVERVAGEVGLDVVIWDVNSADYALQSSAPVVRQVLKRAEPGDDILAHDIWGSIWQHALPQVLEEFVARGWGFDTICANTTPMPKPPYPVWTHIWPRIS